MPISGNMTEGLMRQNVAVLLKIDANMQSLLHNPSVTAYAVPPPFTQGRLLACTLLAGQFVQQVPGTQHIHDT